MKTRFSIILVVASLIIVSLACGGEDDGATLTPVVIIATSTPGGQAESTTAPEPTSTPVPGECTNSLEFIADVSIPDGTFFGPNESFIKTWRVRNDGTCDWRDYHLVFDRGEPMGTLDQVIPHIPAGEVVDLSIEMTAPGGAGAYKGYWQVQSSEGAVLGTLFCDIVVQTGDEEPGEEEPSEEPGEEPAPPGAPAAPSEMRIGGWSMDTVTLEWNDNSDNEDGFRVRQVGAGWLDPVGANVTSIQVAYPPCGETAQYRVRAFNSVGDSERSNTVTVEGTICPDFVFDSISVEPTSNDPQTVRVEMVIRNAGQGDSNTFTVRWFPHQASEEVGCSRDPQALQAGTSTQTLTCRYTYTGHGEMHWVAVIDPDDEVFESDETNNRERGTVGIE